MLPWDTKEISTGNMYGDGRTISVGEVLIDESRWELQLKGEWICWQNIAGTIFWGFFKTCDREHIQTYSNHLY